MSVYAFVFARGGSKGLPGKNIKPLAGVPLLGHAIRLAQQIKTVKRVFVSTDCDEIAAVAECFSADVIRRPAHLAADDAAEWFAWQHAVEHVQQNVGEFDVFLSLPTTSPLRSQQDVERCLAALDESADAVVTVTPASRSPYFNMVTVADDGLTEVVLRDANISRRQDAPVVYDMTTVAYVTRPTFILSGSGVFSGRVKSVVVPKERAVDIDDSFDFAIAEALYKE